jgi:hypothetical protein
MKASVFVGSSSEGLPAANAIKGHLDRDADVTVWDRDIFVPSQGTLDTLLKCIERFDFAVLVFTADDLLERRGTESAAPRDNVVFELGMCFGRFGPRRTFAVCQAEANIKIPSDLAGITIPRFSPIDPDGDMTSALKPVCEQILDAIRRNAGHAELRLLPSTALAIGYFENFIKPVCRGKFDHAGRTYNLEKEPFKLVVLMPDHFGPTFHTNLPTALRDAAFEEVTVNTSSRGFPFYVRTDMSEGALELYDIPTTLSVLPRAIGLYLGKQYVGTGVDERVLQAREITNFRRTIEQLLEDPEHWRLKKIVEIRNLPDTAGS